MGFPQCGAVIRRLAAVVAKAWVVPDSSAGDDAPPPPDVERDASAGMEHRVSMGEEISTSSAASASAAPSTSGQGPCIQSGWVHVLARQFLPEEKIVGGMGAATSAVKHHICGIFWMLEVSTEQSEDRRKHRKRVYEFTKKAATFEAVLLFALCNQQPYSRNTAFKVALAMLLLAFFINVLTSLLLLNSFNFPFKHLIYTSSIIQMLMPFALLVSSGQLQPYTILISLLPFFSITLIFNRAVTDDSELDHIFDQSAGVYALLSAGCALASPYFISKESAAASPLACSLFLTILIARYLMLISTMRPPEIVQDAKTLMFVLKLLVALTVIFLSVEFGWQLALVVISVGAIDAVLFSKNLLAHSPGTTKGDNEPSDQIQRKDQQQLSAVLVGILFMALTQTYSEHVVAHEASLGSAAILRMLLYLGAFLWSLNRMIITPGDAAAPSEGEHTAISVWSALEWARASVVVAAVLDMIWKFGIAFIMGSIGAFVAVVVPIVCFCVVCADVQ